jgi:nicotinamide-nucleotide amidase
LDLKIEFILIGDELLSGHKKDANLQQLTTYLNTLGLRLSFIQVVGDTMDHIQNAFILASKRSHIIISSGGLGPTKDDLTKAALAQTFSLPLMTSEEAKQTTMQHYERVGRVCNFEVNHYDQLPKGCEALFNPIGFAPSIFYHDQIQKFCILLAPGVPKEFKAIIEAHGNKLLSTQGSFEAKTLIQWRTYGIPEEKIFSELCPTLWDELSQFGAVASLPHLSGVDISLTLATKTLEKEKSKIDQLIHSSGLIPYIWSTEKNTLAEYLVYLAKKKKCSFSFVESCTGGFASHLITQVSGCSEVFKGSLVTYQTELKQSLLKIDPSITGADGVNEKTALAMSLEGQKITASDYCISFTGFAGPSGGSKDNPPGRLWMALTDKNGNQLIKKLDLIGNRLERIERFTYAGLHFLRQELEKLVE